MKVYLRDRITAGLGVSVLAVLAAMSYYYSIHTETEALRAEIIRESPDFTSTNIALTQFKADGTAERRIFADYAAWKGVTVDTSGMAMQEAPDYGTIQEADLEGMTFCYYAGLMTGNQNGELMPYETLSRAEFAQMLMNYDALMSQADQAA